MSPQAQLYICYAQSVDLRNPGIVLIKPWIHGLFAQSRDRPYVFNPINSRIDPLPCHPGEDQNISGHIVLDQNVCVI